MAIRFLPVLLPLLFLAGVAAGSGQHPPAAGGAIAFAALGGIFAYAFRRRKILFVLFIGMAFLAAGYAYVSFWRQHYQERYPLQKEGFFEGIVDEPPDERSGYTFLTVRTLPGLRGGRLLVKVNRYPQWRYGDRLAFKGTPVAPEAFNGFDYPLYLERFHIYAIVRQPKSLRLVSHGHGSPLLRFLYALRQRIEQQLQAHLPEPESSFLGGILLGSKRAIPQDVQDALRYSGTTHIIAISGANITILLSLLLQFLPFSSQRSQLGATAAVALFMILLTGASASVIRGGLVACLSRWLRMRSRRAWPVPFLTCSICLIVLGNPLLLVADPGFQLSFAAFAGLAFLGAPLAGLLERNRFSRGMPEAVRGAAAETTAATLATSFFSLRIFGQISWLGLIVNPLILWLLPPITLLGLLMCLPLPSVFGLWLSLPLWLLLHTVLAVIQGSMRIPAGLIVLNHAT